MIQPSNHEPRVIDLRELVHVIRRRRRSIIWITLLTLATAVVVIGVRSPVYTSRAQVEVRPLTVDEQLQPFATDSFVNMETEAARVTQEPVAALAAPDLGLDPDSPSDLSDAAEDVQVSVQPNTTFLDVSCTRSDAEQARDCAAAFAAAYVDDRIGGAEDLYEAQTTAELDRIDEASAQIDALRDQLTEPGAAKQEIRAAIEELDRLITAAQTSLLALPTASPNAAVLSRSADLPSVPSNKNYLLVGGLAVLLGLALGIGAALVRERLVEPIGDRDKLEASLDARTLGVVPAVTPRMDTRRNLAALDAPDGPEGQAYLAMAAMLRGTVDARPGMIVVTSPARAEGKSRTTANLAVALAGKSRVAAVSCDLRNPRLHELFERGNDVGVTTLLAGRSRLADSIQVTAVDDLFLIASGPAADNSAELLGSEEMSRLLDALRTGFDFVLIDTGPGLEMADVLLLAPRVDGFVVVADAEATSRNDVSDLRSRLESAGGRIVGGVLTNVARRHVRAARGGRPREPRIPPSDEASPAGDISTVKVQNPEREPAATSASASGPRDTSNRQPTSGSKTKATTSRSKSTTSKSATTSKSRSTPTTPRSKPRSTPKTTAAAGTAPTSVTDPASATPQLLRTPPDGTDGEGETSTNGEAAKSTASASMPSPSGSSDDVSPGGRSDESRAATASHQRTSAGRSRGRTSPRATERPKGQQPASEPTSRTTSKDTVTDVETPPSAGQPTEEAIEADVESSRDGKDQRSSDPAE